MSPRPVNEWLPAILISFKLSTHHRVGLADRLLAQRVTECLPTRSAPPRFEAWWIFDHIDDGFIGAETTHPWPAGSCQPRPPNLVCATVLEEF